MKAIQFVATVKLKACVFILSYKTLFNSWPNFGTQLMHLQANALYLLQAFQREIKLNHSRLEEISEHAQILMQRSDPLDSVIIQTEMDELHRYSMEVFDQVGRFQRKLERLSIAQVGVLCCHTNTLIHIQKPL